MSTASAPKRDRPRDGSVSRPSRVGRWVGLGAVVLLALVVAAIWVVPGMLDWNRYRGSIAGLVAAGIGRPVRIGGDITLQLLPQPTLTATDLEVEDSGDGLVMTVKAVRLRVALGSLIAGRVDARELTMQGADLRLPWPPPAGALARRPPAWITGLQARVEGSRLQVGGLVLDGIDAALGADPDTGTLSAAGSAALMGLPTHFTIRLGRPGRDGAAPLDISLDGQGRLRDTGGTVSGTVEADGTLNGRVAARGPDLSQLIPAPATSWRADGRISAAGGVVVADELSLEIGGSPARGAVALRVQPALRLDLALAAGRIDLDAWTPVLLRSAQAGAPLPFPTGLDLSAESATLAGGVLRTVRLALDLEPGSVRLREAAAILPGDAALTLHGQFPKRGKSWSFDGDGRLIAPDLRATLRWLEPVAPAVVRALPADAFRTADLTGKLALDPAQLSLTDLAGTVDGSKVEGGLALRLGARPAISFGLTADRLSLDPFLPDATVLANPAAAYAALVRSVASAGFDCDAKLQLRQAVWRGARFGPLALDVGGEAGRLTVRRFDVTAAGFHAALSGTVGEGGKLTEGRLEASAQDLAPLRPFLPERAEDWAGLLKGPATLLVTAAGPPEALAMRAIAELHDLRVDAQPVLNLPGHRWAGPLTLQHPGASRLLAQAGWEGVGPWLGDGSFSLIAQLSGSAGRVDVGGIDLIAGALRAGGQLVFARGAVQGQLRAEVLPLPPLNLRSPSPLPMDVLRVGNAALHLEAERVLAGLEPVATDLALDLSIQGGALSVENLVAKRDAAAWRASARLEPGPVPRLTIRTAVDHAALDSSAGASALNFSSGTLRGSLNATGTGFSPAGLLSTLDGTASVHIDDATMTGLSLPGAMEALAQPDAAKLLQQLRQAMTAGTTAIPTIDASVGISRGVAAVRAIGHGNDFSAAASGTLDLPVGSLSGRLTFLPIGGLPPLPQLLSGSPDSLTRTPELAGVARWLANRP